MKIFKNTIKTAVYVTLVLLLSGPVAYAQYENVSLRSEMGVPAKTGLTYDIYAGGMKARVEIREPHDADRADDDAGAADDEQRPGNDVAKEFDHRHLRSRSSNFGESLDPSSETESVR